MTSLDKEFTCIFSSSDNKNKTYIIPCKLLAKTLFKSWHLNRPSDKLRVNEIRNYLLDTKPEKIEGEIFAAQIESEWENGNCSFEVYDGNHRREAICSGFSELCPNAKVIVSIIKVKDDGELLDHFRRINKMVPLSEADLVGEPNIRDSLHKIAYDYSIKYPTLVKTNTRPNRPYFNRDDFVDSLYKIYTECNLENSNELIKALESMNNYIEKAFDSLLDENKKTKTVNGLTITHPMYMTAHKNGLYLFLCKDVTSDVSDFIKNKYLFRTLKYCNL